MKIMAVQLNPTIGDIVGNTEKILKGLKLARKKNVEVVVFPEMAICGYPAEDLLFFDKFIEKIKEALDEIVKHSSKLFVIVGLPRAFSGKEKKLLNSAAIIIDGKLVGFKDKELLPTYDVFNEKRYFEEGVKIKQNQKVQSNVWKYTNENIGVLICEDNWGVLNKYSVNPVEEMKKLKDMEKPSILINISASPYYFKKRIIREKVFSISAKMVDCPIVFCNQVGGNDQLVFDGYSFFMDKNGEILQKAKGFEEDYLIIDTNEKQKKCFLRSDDMYDLYNGLILGVRDYFHKQNFKKACIGLSGGIDSALTAKIAVDALGFENVVSIYMPTKFSSKQSKKDAYKMAKKLNIKISEILIDDLYEHYLDKLKPLFSKKTFDTTEQNIQARIRGMVLMAFSNKEGYLVLSTGNKSEMAVGYTTLYGDMAGGFALLMDVTKTQVYQLAGWINKNDEIIPRSIIEKEPSAELRENQKDSDDLPKYEIIDKILNLYVEENATIEEIVKKTKFPKKLVKELVLKIHAAEYKRRQGPIGIVVTKKAFSKGRFFPIVQKWITK